jgi:PAS domain S-box-containing protein
VTAQRGLAPTWNEQDRLKAIDSYDILDTPHEEEFDDIVKMAAQACNVPISLISFVTSERQWFKARLGLGSTETPLNCSICSHAILQKDILVVPDTTKDPRTRDNPLVTADPHVRFYAGALLESPEGLPLGTVCVLDYEPRTLSEKEADTLRILARQVMTQLELRRTLSELRRALQAKSKNEERLNFLSQLTQKLSMLPGPEELNRVATREVGKFLGAHRCYFFEAIPPDLHTRVLPDWCALGEKSLQGVYDLAIFGAPEMWQALQGSSVHLDDVRTHPWTEPFLANYQAMNIGAALIAPFTREGKWVVCLGVSSNLPRQWTTEEQTLLEDVMARVWPLIEKARIAVELRASEERFRAMSDNIAPLAWMAKADGFIFWYNKRWSDYTGETLESMQGDGWIKVHDPECLPRVMEKWKHAVTLGHPWEDTFPLRGADGIFRWFLSRAVPIRDAEGNITLWFGVNTDITELREAQNALSEANTLLGDKAILLESLVKQRTQSLSETIGELEAFSYSISHDMRAPLRSMIGYADILKEDCGAKLDDAEVDYLNRICNASRRMDQLIQDVLVFSRLSREEVVLQPVDTDALMRDIIESYPNLHPDVVTISIKSALPVVKGNEALLTQCFSNLLDNGAKFVAQGAKGRLEVWGETSGNDTRLCFKDDGIGMEEHHLERIFDIFHRVGRDGNGTGIGLAIVRKAVEKMGGTLGVKSELGKGSLFWLDLHPA